VRASLDGLRATAGLGSRQTLASRANLALVYHETGRAVEAVRLYGQVLAEFNRLLGPDHPDAVAVRETLATAVSQMRERQAD
jgi:Tetratricopeptide repeat